MKKLIKLDIKSNEHFDKFVSGQTLIATLTRSGIIEDINFDKEASCFFTSPKIDILNDRLKSDASLSTF